MANHHNTPAPHGLIQLVKQSSSNRQKNRKASEIPEAPELPEVSEVAEVPEVPELPEAPKLPELPKVSSDLVSQARNARMAKEGTWPFRPNATSVEDLYYNQQLARYVVLPTLLGGGLAGAAALVRAMKSAPPKDMIAPQRVTAGPMTIDIPLDRDDDEEDSPIAIEDKTAGWNIGPPPGSTEQSLLTSKWAPMWLWPGAAALMYGGYEAGDLLGRYINKKRRKSRREQSIESARSEYDSAIQEQRDAAKEASYNASIDNLFEASRTANDGISTSLEKEGELPFGLKHWGDVAGLDFGAIGSKVNEKFAPGISRYAGTLGVLALLAGIPSGMLVYDKLRTHPKQDDLTEAIRRRRAEIYRRRPSAVQLELNEIAQPEDDTDDAITPAAA